MILDDVDNLLAYRALSPLIDEVAAWLREHPNEPDGRYDVVGDDVFALVQTYETAPAEAKRWETHRRYVDVQCVLTGAERIGYAPRDGLKVSEPYVEARDVEFYESPVGAAALVEVAAGKMMLLGPRDAHLPGVQRGAPETVRKVVFKLAAASFGW